jgi:membrane-bound metal-dependent hydrolase YbcI (DUF457 family)
MFLGHAALAFAVAAFLATATGVRRDRALAFGLTAGLFAAVPDVDMAYALTGLTATGDVVAITESFWAASTLVHRAITHSLVVAVPAAVAFVLAAGDRRDRAVSGLLLAALVGVSTAVSGWLGGAIMLLFGGAGSLVGHWSARYGFDRRTTLGLAVLGLASHPFGDVFTGEPPRLLYPLNMTVFDGRIALHGDPTLHLLGAFAIELAAIWLAVLAFHRVSGVPLQRHVNARAAIGVAYGLAVFVIPPPTLDVSYQFVFSVLAVGVVGAVPHPVRRRLPDVPTAVVTGLAATSLAGFGYALAYVLGTVP